MRRVRDEAGVSLRDLENLGAWRRSTISQVETGKARPSRELVQWYDSELGSDGLLLSIYAEARSRQLLARQGSDPVECPRDALSVIDVDPPAGLLVDRGARLQATITLANSGRTQWRGRLLHRMGAYAGLRLINSPSESAVPETAPGQMATVVLNLRAPERAGSVIAYWSMVDRDGRECATTCPPIAILLVVEAENGG
jgi:transcriptional regulator with XRE-family HTH domain